MKNLFTNKLPSLVLLCLFFICGAFVGSAPAQLKDTVIVDGNPALKQSDVDKLQDFFEWLFEKKFSKAQKGEFQSLVIKKWQSGEMEITAFLGVLKSHTEIQALNESDREKIRQLLLPQALDTLRRRRNEINEFLTAIYENSRNDSSVSNSDQNAIENAGSGGSVTLADLAGTWSSGNVSGIRYKNLTNGDLSDVSGNMSEYIVSAKGDIQYTGYLSTTIYSCSTRLFFYQKRQNQHQRLNDHFRLQNRRTRLSKFLQCFPKRRQTDSPAEKNRFVHARTQCATGQTLHCGRRRSNVPV
jgi:hypothetical protein